MQGFPSLRRFFCKKRCKSDGFLRKMKPRRIAPRRLQLRAPFGIVIKNIQKNRRGRRVPDPQEQEFSAAMANRYRRERDPYDTYDSYAPMRAAAARRRRGAAAKRRKKKNRKARAQRRIVLALVVVVFVLAGLIAVSEGVVRRPQVDETVPGELAGDAAASTRKDGFYTVLLCGTDDGNGGSDTIMLAAVDTENKAIHVVSIPRDTLVNEDWTVKKINSAYNRGGIEGVEEQVEKIFGFPVDFYVTVDLQAFVDLVNAIDGVDFEVPIDMNYDDPAQDLHIHFSAGMQHLDGQEALEVVRFRHNNDGSGYPMQDLDRIKTQHRALRRCSRCAVSSRSPSLPGSSLSMWTATWSWAK